MDNKPLAIATGIAGILSIVIGFYLLIENRQEFPQTTSSVNQTTSQVSNPLTQSPLSQSNVAVVINNNDQIASPSRVISSNRRLITVPATVEWYDTKVDK